MPAASRHLSTWLAALACILLAGCTAASIEMEIEDVGGRKVVTLFTRGFFGGRSEEIPCIREVIVSTIGARQQAQRVWGAVARDVQCTSVRSFVIGRTPPGFTETVNRIPTQMRGRYRVEVEGIGSGVYDIIF